MKKLSLKNAKSMLSRKEMKAINGGYDGDGGSCCVTVVGNVATDRTCGYSLQGAKAEATLVASWGNGIRAYWCCDSC